MNWNSERETGCQTVRLPMNVKQAASLCLRSHPFQTTGWQPVSHHCPHRVTTDTQRPDHPILATIPETEYLRGYAYEVVASW